MEQLIHATAKGSKHHLPKFNELGFLGGGGWWYGKSTVAVMVDGFWRVWDFFQ